MAGELGFIAAPEFTWAELNLIPEMLALTLAVIRLYAHHFCLLNRTVHALRIYHMVFPKRLHTTTTSIIIKPVITLRKLKMGK